MTLSEMWPDPRLAITAVQGGYLLQAEHPTIGDILVESSAALNAVVARASELIKAGYRTEIWSPAAISIEAAVQRAHTIRGQFEVASMGEAVSKIA